MKNRISGRTKVKLTVGVRSQESARIARITFLKTDDRIYVRLLSAVLGDATITNKTKGLWI